MSGRPFNSFTRRDFLRVTAGSFLLAACGTKAQPDVITGQLIEPDSRLGHRMRDADFPAPSLEEFTELVILGGGISGLSAARWLRKQKINDFTLLELSADTGGNSASGSNAVSSYPWAAHYLPVPNTECTELISFLQESQVIRTVTNGVPEYEEQHLCFDPQERLFIKGTWQDGLMPEYGLPAEDLAQTRAFIARMDEFRVSMGSDGKPAFAIPLDDSSGDAEFRKLDEITMKEFLDQNGFTSSYVQWYVNYCCLDDFGTRSEHTSAWAGIHYFASRRGYGTNAEAGSILTWPEGNSFLAAHLAESCREQIKTSCAVFSVTESTDGLLEVNYFDDARQQSVKLKTKQVISCLPQFVNARLFPSFTRSGVSSFTYCPWVVANITTTSWPDKDARPLSWDNVTYNSSSLGYVNATHQHMKLSSGKTVLTWYYPLADREPAEARKFLREQTYEQLRQLVLDDLSATHPGCKANIASIDIRTWGHAMIRPVRNFIWSQERADARKPIGDKIFFAHSDLSGISIFEEAFYAGIRAAQEALNIPTA
jgi:hypothetical protein